MPSREDPAQRGRARGTRLRLEIGQAMRAARRTAGLSQLTVARRSGMSKMQVSRVERGLGSTGVVGLATLASIVGLDLVVKVYPGGAPVKDVAHARLLGRLQASLPTLNGWRTEVPLPIPGDQRAVDAELQVASRRIGFELETRLGDAQATARRVALKQRDAVLACMVLVLADTRANRAAILGGAPTLKATFPLESRAVMASLRNGAPPSGNGVVLV